MSRVILLHDWCRTSSDPQTTSVVAAAEKARGPSMAALSGHDTSARGPGCDETANSSSLHLSVRRSLLVEAASLGHTRPPDATHCPSATGALVMIEPGPQSLRWAQIQISDEALPKKRPRVARLPETSMTRMPRPEIIFPSSFTE